MALAGERFDEAASRFRAAYALAGEASAEEKASIRLQTGIALQAGGQFAEARKELGQAVKEAPKSSSARQANVQLLYPDHFAVQTGAYKDVKNADREKALRKEKGFPAEVFPMDLSQGKFYCVRVGSSPPAPGRRAPRAHRGGQGAPRDREAGGQARPALAVPELLVGLPVVLHASDVDLLPISGPASVRRWSHSMKWPGASRLFPSSRYSAILGRSRPA